MSSETSEAGVLNLVSGPARPLAGQELIDGVVVRELKNVRSSALVKVVPSQAARTCSMPRSA